MDFFVPTDNPHLINTYQLIYQLSTHVDNFVDKETLANPVTIRGTVFTVPLSFFIQGIPFNTYVSEFQPGGDKFLLPYGRFHTFEAPQSPDPTGCCHCR